MRARPTAHRAWVCLAALLGVIALVGVSGAHAARLELSTPSLTAIEMSGCGQAVVFVRALDSGDGVVVTDLPTSCVGAALDVEVRSTAGDVLFTGHGVVPPRGSNSPLEPSRTTVLGVAAADLRSPAARQATVRADGWPLAAAWLPSGQQLGATPFVGAEPDSVAVAHVGWQVFGANQFCAVVDVANRGTEPVAPWMVEIDLTTAPFHYGDTTGSVRVESGLDTDLEDNTLYVQPPGWQAPLQPGATVTFQVCDDAAPLPPPQHPGAGTYGISSELIVDRGTPSGPITRTCVRLTVTDHRPDGLFWIGWYGDLDWHSLLDQAQADGRITSGEHDTLRGKVLGNFWPAEGDHGGTFLTTPLSGGTYRVVGGTPLEAIAPGGMYSLHTCVW